MLHCFAYAARCFGVTLACRRNRPVEMGNHPITNGETLDGASGDSRGRISWHDDPRFLARLPYGRETEPLETFQFEEFDGAPKHDDYLLGKQLFYRCFADGPDLLLRTAGRWNSVHPGRRTAPMHMYKLDGETVFQPCCEVLLTQNACEQMMEHGLMPLVSYKNTDHVKLARFQSIRRSDHRPPGRW